MTEALHPEHLKSGDMVGPWRIVQVLGRGGSSRVFKVERKRKIYSLKMGLCPLSDIREELSEDEYVEERSAYRQLAREAAALFTYSSHPNLLCVYAVDFWPDPSKGYPFIVTDYVDGDDWHRSRWRKPFHAAGLVDTFSDVVRTVDALHKRGVYHRDLKAENILIRRTDGRPFLIDFGTVRLPGAFTKTMGVPDGALHLLPPELLAYTRSGALGRGEPFQGGVPADLYALGVLLYQGLTDLHPFNPELPDKQLVAAIATVVPVAPHVLNPRAPRSLSDIALKLLEKKPEERYPNTQALLHALAEAAEQEKASPAWKVPLTLPEKSVTEAPPEQEPGVEHPRAAPEVEEAQPQEEAPGEKAAGPTARSSRRRLLLTTLACVLLVGAIGLLIGRALLEPSPAAHGASATDQRGTPPVSTTPQDSATPIRGISFSSLLAAWLCAATGLGCPAAQVKPEPAECPEDAQHAMFEELRLTRGSYLAAILDINQPGDNSEEGTYRDGPIVGRVVQYVNTDPALPVGTLLYGQLWTGPGFHDKIGREAVHGRYTQALLPDGRKVPVCIVVGGTDGRWAKLPGSKADAAVLRRVVPVSAVSPWP
ncbi:serine/threonine-protein kinase [Vitiosangium sp. GDMCC 1.1324]|uniref:serine/threonine protein kinase n=1 Tax=Vitiosangium sp. (strain GDMCC 1.1324) TaxID=2138576 RepID=UPI000D37DE2A|nr:serine/threonine-protein kinase [Vitiosangium sp. GDMCC 1.1324]PTL84969.1 serine/threonine protein kinase [Vitiosangium sp. GDMCC 1.1324]